MLEEDTEKVLITMTDTWETLLTISMTEPFNPEEEICKENEDEREVEGIPHLHDIVGQAK